MLLLRSAEPHAVLDQFSAGEIERHFDYISNQLGDNEFILGDSFSAADFAVSYVVSLAKRLQQLQGYPTLEAYLQRNFSRAAYLRAVEKAVE
jgi:glutathione S-transferase